jgi:hypothetical protein
MTQQPLVVQGLLIIDDSWSHSVRHTTIGGSPLDEWSARHRVLYLIHNTHKRQTSMSPAGFEPKIPASERPHTHALDTRPLGSATTTITHSELWLNGSDPCLEFGEPEFCICVRRVSIVRAFRFFCNVDPMLSTVQYPKIGLNTDSSSCHANLFQSYVPEKSFCIHSETTKGFYI